jgi:hypothetical protein
LFNKKTYFEKKIAKVQIRRKLYCFLWTYVTACPQQRLRLEQARQRLERKLLQTRQQRQEAEQKRQQLDNRIVKAGPSKRQNRIIALDSLL